MLLLFMHLQRRLRKNLVGSKDFVGSSIYYAKKELGWKSD